MIQDIDLEEIALCSIIQQDNFDLYTEAMFTQERRYLYDLLVVTSQKYNGINHVFAEMVHREKHDEIMEAVRTDNPSLIMVPYSFVEYIFEKAYANIIMRNVSDKLVPSLSMVSKQREYAKAVQELNKRVQSGIFTPLDDIMALEAYTTIANYKALNFIERFEKYKEVEESQIIRTGHDFIDDQTSFVKGNITVLGGDTGSMKTTSALWLIINILIANPTYTAIFFEKEMPISDIMSKIISFFTAEPTNKIIMNKSLGVDAINKYLGGDHAKSEQVIDILTRLKLVDTNEFHTIEDMLNYIESEKADIWCLDFLTQMFQGSKDPSGFNFEVMQGMNKIKRIVQRTGSTALILAQLKKGTIENRLLKVPGLDDLEWSGTIKQLANSVFMTFFPRLYYSKTLENGADNYFYLCNKKNRFGTQFNIPFIAKPHINQLDKPQTDGAAQWLNAYIAKLSQF